MPRAYHRLQQEHIDVFVKLAERRAATVHNADGNAGNGVATEENHTNDSALSDNSSISQLLELDVPVDHGNAAATSDNTSHLIAAAAAWSQWTHLTVKWPAASSNGKYNVLKLYYEVDVLKWFRDHGASQHPAVAQLARVYLGKPMSTATQERFFSECGYVVNELRSSLDDKRAEMLCLLKGNWAEYRRLMRKFRNA